LLAPGHGGRLAGIALQHYMILVPIHQKIAATNADAGIVKIQAHTILPATPQRTADRRCAEPTPTMAP
jgi:hypothetical protein